MGKKQSLSTEERTQIVNLKNLTFSIRQIAKNEKVSKTAVHNAIMKYRNEGVFIDKKGLADQRLPPTDNTALCVRQLLTPQ